MFRLSFHAGDFAHGQGRYAKVEPLCKRSPAIWEEALGPERPDMAQSLANQ